MRNEARAGSGEVKRSLLFAFLLAGCATLSPERGHDQVGLLVAERGGPSTGWEKGSPDLTVISNRVNSLLAPGLSRASAVAIALINNPGLQATYEELGVSQADMVQAGLLKNPTLAGSVGFPLNVGAMTEFEFSILQDIVDLVTLSWRMDVAKQQFKASTFRVAQQALDVVSEVNRAFVTFQAELEIEKLIRNQVEGAEGAHLLAEKQFAVGNINALLLANEQATYARLQLELIQSEVRVATSREHLNRALGLWGKSSQWTVAGPLADLPPTDPLPDVPESIAIRQRLDLAVARMDAEVMGQMVTLARNTRLFGRVEIGAHVHRDSDGPQLIGPTFSLELPIFDQRTAYIARLEAQRASASRRVSALAIEIRSRVREGVLSLKASRAMASYLTHTLVPLRDKIVEQSQLHYNGMLLGLFELVATQRESSDARRSAILARRDYWIARFDLENALGSSLSRGSSAQ